MRLRARQGMQLILGKQLLLLQHQQLQQLRGERERRKDGSARCADNVSHSSMFPLFFPRLIDFLSYSLHLPSPHHYQPTAPSCLRSRSSRRRYPFVSVCCHHTHRLSCSASVISSSRLPFFLHRKKPLHPQPPCGLGEWARSRNTRDALKIYPCFGALFPSDDEGVMYVRMYVLYSTVTFLLVCFFCPSH